jgi:AcrR family transcriptional regulator
MRESKKINRKLVIQNTALDLFGKSGFDKITISQIAEKAGLGVGTLYNYFKTKGDILLSIIENRSFEYIDELNEILNNNSIDIFKSCELFIDCYLKSFSIYNKLIWREFMANVLSKEPDLMKNIYKIDLVYLQYFSKMISKFINSGIIKINIDIENFVSTYYCACMFSILNYIADDKMELSNLKIELIKHSDLLFNGIIK